MTADVEIAELRLEIALKTAQLQRLSQLLRASEREAAEYRTRLLACAEPAAFRPLRVVA